jgi:hypothetical protein
MPKNTSQIFQRTPSPTESVSTELWVIFLSHFNSRDFNYEFKNRLNDFGGQCERINFFEWHLNEK